MDGGIVTAFSPGTIGAMIIYSKLGLLIAALLIILIGRVQPAAGQENELAHLVLPGDTWDALALRYGVPADQLRPLVPHPNRWRQPAIGSIITLPVGTDHPEQTGRLMRPYSGGLWSVAARSGVNPRAIAAANGIDNLNRPLFGEPIVVPGNETLRDYPAGFLSLTVSHLPGRSGEAMALAGRLEKPPVEAGLTLGTAEGAVFINYEQNRAVGLIATGAFFRPDAPELSVQIPGEPLWVQPWQFSDKTWTFNDITLTGDAANISQEAIQQERARLFELWAIQTPRPQWQTRFEEPVVDFLSYSSLYGARRSYNGGPYRTYHEGLDYAAYGGTPVYAPAAGTVVLAETLYVRGGAVIIDHGLGIYSGYYHLSKLLVEPGAIQPGTQIGEVGTTGLSTGNHLHWDLLVNGIWVDPGAFHEQNMSCWILEGWGTPCSD